MSQDVQPVDPVGHLYLALGEEKIRAMVAAFYEQVPGDDLLGPMYPSTDMVGARERLADFIVFRLGGPRDYLEKRGHPRLRMRHVPFSIGVPERDRWMELMTTAAERVEIPAEHAKPLLKFFSGIADMLVNRPAE